MKRIINLHINEKFTPESDPVFDLGVGVPAVAFYEKCHEYAKKAESQGVFRSVSDIRWYSEETKETFIDGVLGSFSIESNHKTLVKTDVKRPIYGHAWESKYEQFRILLVKKEYDGEFVVHVYNVTNGKSYFPKKIAGFLAFTKGYKQLQVDEKFTPESDPIVDMGIGAINKIFEISKHFYSFTSGYYSEKEWKKIISWMLEEYEPWEVLVCLDHKLMRYAYDDMHNSKYQATLNDFQNYNVKYMSSRNESEMDRILQNYRVMQPDLVEHYQNIAKEAGIYKEPIHEKFSEIGDPIKDMGIGIFKKKEFDSSRKAAKYMYSVLPAILSRDDIPNDIIYPIDYRTPDGKRLAFNNEYFKEIVDFLQQYVILKDDYGIGRGDVLLELNKILLMAGYPKDVNEKFVEKSDPIKDMEIGVFSPRTFTDIDDGADFLLQVLPTILGTDKIPDDIIVPKQSEETSFYGFNQKYEKLIFPYFKKYITAKAEDALWLRVSILTAAVFQLRNMGYPKKVKEDIKESINEKFTEKSDPVHDMGIGIEKAIENFCEENEPDSAYDKESWLWICVKYKKKDFVEYLINNGWDINANESDAIFYAIVNDDFEMIEFLLDNGAKINTKGIWKQMRKNHPESYKFILKHKGVKRIRESININEIFKEEPSDPIADMGIGGYTFETLKPGAVIKAKRIGIAVTQNQSGQFTNWSSGMKLSPNNIILIVNVSPKRTVKLHKLPAQAEYSSVYKDIIFKKFYGTDEGSIKNFKEAREILQSGKIPRDGFVGRMIVSKKQFDNRFEIIERGFATNESVNEKFEEESDPLHDMGIGIVAVREFDTVKEAAKTFVDNIKILTANKFHSKQHLRKTITDSRQYNVPMGTPSTLRECKNYLEGLVGERKYDPLTIKEWGERFDKQLSKLQCLKDFRDEVISYATGNHIDEKFSKESDPIEDMGIGIYSVLKEEYDKIVVMGLNERAEYLFKNRTYANGAFATQALLKLIIKNKLLDKRNILNLEETLDDIRRKYGLSNFGIDLIVKYFKDKFKVKIPHFYKSVYEKFEEGGDPVEQMGIGLRVVIDEWLEENDTEGDVEGGYMTPAMFIVKNHKYPETVKAWIEFLLREGKEKIKDWEEDYVEDMNGAGVKFIPNSKVLPHDDFSYEIKNGQCYLYTSDWSNFKNYFNLHGDIGEEFIEAVLEGDARRYFEYNYGNQQLNDLEDALSTADEQKLFDYLKPICEEHAGMELEADNISDLLDIVKEDIPEVHEALLHAYSNNVADAEEQAAYKDIIGTIRHALHITEEKYEDNKLILKISEEALNKFFISWYLKDYGIEYWPPQYGWGGDFNLEYFIEDFENALE